MQIPILIEKLPEGQGFEASTGGPLGLSARAPAREQAVRDLEGLVRARLAADVEYAVLTIPDARPLTPVFGTLDPSDPAVQEWKENVEEYRRACDERADYPWLHAGADWPA